MTQKFVLPDPFGYVEHNEIEMDIAAHKIAAELSMINPDRRTKQLGDTLTDALARHHEAKLESQGKTWNGQYLFIGSYMLKIAYMTITNPGVLEAIRRGFYPFEKIDVVLRNAIRNVVDSIERWTETAHFI